MERESTTVTTPLGKELVLKKWLTAKERNDYFVTTSKQGIDANDPKSMQNAVAALVTAPQLINTCVISYDGKTEGIPAMLDNLQAEEFDFVMNECGKIVAAGFPQAK